MKGILKLPDEEILNVAYQLREGYKMKRILRYKTKRDFTVHSESDAEHVFGLIYLAQYFLQVEPAGPSLDAAKLDRILLFHDFGEIKHGDAVTYYKTKEHEEREKEAAKEVFASLPPSLQKIGLDAWREYEERESPEAHFAYALDKIEPLFELFDPINEQSMKRLKVTYGMHISNKVEPVKDYPAMKRFTEVLSKDMHGRDVFWKE